MEQSLSIYFSGIGAKRLSRVEINSNVSNQHEFNGINEFRSFLGNEKKSFNGKFIYLTDDSDSILIEEGTLTWYDARENTPNRTEYRLYYSSNSVITSSSVDDLLIIGRTGEDDLVVIVAEEGSTAERQMRWLFGLEEVNLRFVVKNFITQDQVLNFAGKQVIETLGFEIEEDDVPDLLEQIIDEFGGVFPKTAAFSEFARRSLSIEVSPIEEPDETLISWLEQEELLFKTLEKYIVSQKLTEGFGEEGVDVDEFVRYSLSVHNRRKSRAGHSFENHLAAIFDLNEINYSRGKKTERNNKPDFLFPSIEQYKNTEFNANLLTMLGVKTSAKDRWRQVLSEAERIDNKHLITLQPAISLNQTEEMRQQGLQLVIPSPIFNTYTDKQQGHLINLSDFMSLVRKRES